MSIEAVGSVPVTFDRDDGFRVPGHVHFDPKAHTSGLPCRAAWRWGGVFTSLGDPRV